MGIFDGIKKRFKPVDEIKELKEKIKNSPNNPTLHQKLAERLIKRGEYSEAILEYYTAASLFEKGGFGLKSIAVFKQCLKIDPTNLDTEKHLITALVNNGLTGDAVYEFQRVMGDKDFFPNQASREDFIRFSLDNIGDIPEIHIHIVKDCIKEKNSLGIISSVEKTIPNIKSKRQLEDFYNFIESVGESVDNSADIWEAFSLSLLSTGFKEKGLQALEKIEQTEDLSDQTRKSIGDVKRYFDEVESDPSFPKYLKAVSEYIEQLKREEEEKEKLQVPDEVEEKAVEGSEDIGVVLDKLREKVESEIGEEDLNARYNLGIAFKEMGLYEEAIREFDISNRDPNLYFSSMLMLKDCYESIEKLDDAIAILNELIEKGGENKQAELDLLYQKAEILDKSGDMEEAKALYLQIFETDNNFRDVAEKLKD